MLSFFFTVLGHFNSFYILMFSLDYRTRLRGVGLVTFLFTLVYTTFFYELVATSPIYNLASHAHSAVQSFF